MRAIPSPPLAMILATMVAASSGDAAVAGQVANPAGHLTQEPSSATTDSPPGDEGEELADPPNPFADIETRILPNGLRVWYKRLPDQPTVHVSLTVPVGRDHDPPGKEQLAHFLEHMLFSDHLGRSEEEIESEIQSKGGSNNGITSTDKTQYFVSIGKEHGLFALEWLYKIISPHAMELEIVEQQRLPVALEVRARPRELFDWIFAHYLYPPWLRLPGFWESEFGITTYASRDYYAHRSLYGITPEDLRHFYDTFYVPSLMTLAVIGDLDREAVMATVDETFATLAARPEPELNPSPRDPGRARRVTLWEPRSNVSYSRRFKIYDPSAADDVMLTFLGRFLGKRLNDRLRFGERKASYGIGVGTVRRGRAAYFSIGGGIEEEELEFARGIIDQELEALRSGSLSDAQFDADRDTVTRQLAVSSSTPRGLDIWVWTTFYHPHRHESFADLVMAFSELTKSDVASFVRQHFVPEREVLMVTYPLPVSQAGVAALLVAIVLLTVAWRKRRLTRLVDMTRIRYVARFKMSILYKLAAVGVVVALVAIVVRLVVQLFLILADRFVVGIESAMMQWPIYGAMLASIVVLLIAAAARWPRKILLFQDRLLIKNLAYRSTSLSSGEIEELSMRRFPEVWLSRRILRCVPLTLALLHPGIYLRATNGRAYFFSVREPDVLFGLLSRFKDG